MTEGMRDEVKGLREVFTPTSPLVPYPFSCVAIVGVGMMGGSLGMALRARGLAGRVVGIDRDAATLAAAVECGAIDAGEIELAAGVREADCVVLAAPVGIVPELLETIAPDVRPDALITDIGSVKSRITAAGERCFGARFVGGHPMAGSEKSGIGAAQADLLTGAAWAIVREKPFALEGDIYAARLAALIEALGARPILLDAAQHDRIVALVSHLPHLLSFAFAAAVGASPEADLARQMAGGSYRDIMRVSQSDPALWHDIFRENRAALRDALAAFETHLRGTETAASP